MPAIIDSVPIHNNKSNSFRTDADNANRFTVKQLQKEQERLLRESSNHGGKNKRKQSARIASRIDTDEIQAETVAVSIIGVANKRVVLKRQKRKPGHRTDGGYNERY